MGQSFVNECKSHPTKDEFGACLADVEAMLDDCGVPHSLANGTLLGMYRDGAPLTSDSNVELYYRQEDEQEVQRCLIHNDIPYVKNFGGNKLEFCCPANRVKVDMYEIVPSLSGKYSCAIAEGNQFDSADLLPFETNHIPADPEAVLNLRYGQNSWRNADDDGSDGPGCWRIGL